MVKGQEMTEASINNSFSAIALYYGQYSKKYTVNDANEVIVKELINDNVKSLKESVLDSDEKPSGESLLNNICLIATGATIILSRLSEQSPEESYAELRELLLKKNKDYKGASFDLGMSGNVVHLWDKVSRLNNLNNNTEPNFEAIDDTLRDIIGYCVIGLHIISKRHG